MKPDDKYFLKQAIKAGNQGKANGISPYNYGAVIVKDNEIIATECAHVHETENPVMHAEVSAIVKACKKLGNHHITGCVMYGSHEPCLMCFVCAAWAKIDRIVYASPASDKTQDTYEFNNLRLIEVAKKLSRPMKVEHIDV